MPTAALFRARPRALAAALVVLSLSAGAAANPVPDSERLDRTEALPERLRGIDVREQLNAAVPKTARFMDEGGRPVQLGDYFDGKHPVVLTLNYSRCPMLCSLELNGLVTALKQVDWSAGKEFKILTVVLDPTEKPEQAAQSKARYLRQYDRAGAEAGWHFLTTTNDSTIHKVADSVGFTYGFNEKRNEYIHPAAVILVSPDGHVARYLYGIEYHPKTVRLSLLDVSDGKIGSSMDQLILYCFHYDEKEGKYAPMAMNIMRVASGAGATALGGMLTSFWIVESRRKKKSLAKPSSEGTARSSSS
jgi:protein SCO1/2